MKTYTSRFNGSFATLNKSEPVPPPPGEVTVTMSISAARALQRIIGNTNGTVLDDVHAVLSTVLCDAGLDPDLLPRAAWSTAFNCIDGLALQKALGL